MIKNNKYKGLFCPVPFESVYIDYNGNVYPHCEGLINESIGNLLDKNLLEVWNSNSAQKIRQSIFNGAFKYCIKRECRVLQEKKLLRNNSINNIYQKDIIKNKSTKLTNGPLALNLGYDPTCNLICRSCRKERLVSRNQRNTSKKIHQKIIGNHLKDVKRVVLSCMGEPFASKLYMDLIYHITSSKYPDIRIQILTNGLLLTHDMWNSIANCHHAINTIAISIDAATKNTYLINRGGDFNLLKKNLEFFANLRKRNVIKKLIFDFVVQANNYKEMKLFIELGKKYSCDWVAFKHIENWGTFTNSEFKRIAIHDSNHPEHKNLLNILTEPFMKDPIVWMRNIANIIHEKDKRQFPVQVSDAEVFNIILNDIEWEFFRTRLMLNSRQAIKIKRIINKMKKQITEIYSHKVTKENVSPLEYVLYYGENSSEKDEYTLLSRCQEYAFEKKNNPYGSLYFKGCNNIESETLYELRKNMSLTQQHSMEQLLKVKSLYHINTGYFPLRNKFCSLKNR